MWAPDSRVPSVQVEHPTPEVEMVPKRVGYAPASEISSPSPQTGTTRAVEEVSFSCAGQKGGSGALGAGSKRVDGINIIDEKTFRAGAGRSGSQSLPSPEVGGAKWVVSWLCLVCVCVSVSVCVWGWGGWLHHH